MDLDLSVRYGQNVVSDPGQGDDMGRAYQEAIKEEQERRARQGRRAEAVNPDGW